MKSYDLKVMVWLNGGTVEEVKSSFQQYLDRYNQNQTKVEDGLIETTPYGYCVTYVKSFQAASWKEVTFDILYFMNLIGIHAQLECITESFFSVTMSSNWYLGTTKFFRLEAQNPDTIKFDFDWKESEAIELAKHYCLDNNIPCVFFSEIGRKKKDEIEVIFLHPASAQKDGGCMTPPDIRFLVNLNSKKVTPIYQM